MSHKDSSGKPCCRKLGTGGVVRYSSLSDGSRSAGGRGTVGRIRLDAVEKRREPQKEAKASIPRKLEEKLGQPLVDFGTPPVTPERGLEARGLRKGRVRVTNARGIQSTGEGRSQTATARGRWRVVRPSPGVTRTSSSPRVGKATSC